MTYNRAVRLLLFILICGFGQAQTECSIRHDLLKYPAIARGAHVTGSVSVTFTVGTKGVVEGEIEVKGLKLLSSGLREVIKATQFAPACVGRHEIQVEFRIGGETSVEPDQSIEMISPTLYRVSVKPFPLRV